MRASLRRTLHAAGRERRAVAAVLGAATLLAVTPATASANAILPMAAGGLLWPFGMVLLGLIEAAVTRLGWKVSFGRAFGVMLLANLASFFLGLLTAPAAADAISAAVFGGPEMLRLGKLVWITISLCWVFTVLVEWPFCLALLRGRPHRPRSALGLTVAANCVTYALLIPYFLTSGDTSLSEQGTFVDNTRFTRNAGAVVYHFDETGRDLWRTELDGSEKHLVVAGAANTEAVVILPVKEDGGHWQLWAWGADAPRLVLDRLPADEEAVLDKTNFSDRSGPRNPSYVTLPQHFLDTRGDSGGFGAHCGDLHNSTLCIDRSPAAPNLYLSYDAPFKFVSWSALNILPNDEAVACMDDQVVLIDLRTARIGFLSMGRAPFVIPAPSIP